MLPNEKELIEYLKKQDLVNFSKIARHFDIQNATVTDLIKVLEKNKLVIVKKLGGSKVVILRKK